MSDNKRSIGTPPKAAALGGGIEGAERTSRETLRWQPPMLVSPDTQINPGKDLADARGRDLALNDGYMMGAVHTNRDSIVGAQYVVNSQPNIDVLNKIAQTSQYTWARKIVFTEDWCEKFQTFVESKFNLISDSPAGWFDATRRNTLTEMVRLGIASHLMSGEIVAAAEWLTDPGRPCGTAIQMISSDRLTNPNDQADSQFMRKGIEFNANGQPIGYYVRTGYPLDNFNDGTIWKWQHVPAEKDWGRRVMIHITEQMLIGQSRGISEMVSAMKQSRMTKKFQDITLQNAVVNASYAAAIESELPKEMIFGMMGGVQDEFANNPLETYMAGLAEYMTGSQNIAIDGVKMPVMYPGTHVNTKNLGTPGGVGTSFEESLLRNIASSLGVSYEQYSRDYTKTNYSSARASMGETNKRMQSKKKTISDRFANEIFTLWMEEDINRGVLPLPDNCNARQFAAFFYIPLAKDALAASSWIGASRGQIDEMKETQAAILRMSGGLSTLEKECSRLGEDWRYVIKQRQREKNMLESAGLSFSGDTTKPSAESSVKEDGDKSNDEDDDKSNKGDEVSQ